MSKRQNKMMFYDTIVFALAGGKGSRLYPLTRHAPKPGLPFGGNWTIIDLVIWSMYQSGFMKTVALVQYYASSISEHIRRGWPQRPDGESYVEVTSPEERYETTRYHGTADAVYQNLHRTVDYDYAFVVGGDHIFLMDGSQVRSFHLDHNAGVSILMHEVSVEEARGFGVMTVDANGRITDFHEKPQKPAEIPGKPGRSYASMGIYFFSMQMLRLYVGDVTFRNAMIQEHGEFDFGQHVIVKMLKDGVEMFAYPFEQNFVPEQPEGTYWRDVGTYGSYKAAHDDLLSDNPSLNLYARDWPIPTYRTNGPGAKLSVRSKIDHSTLSDGCIVTDSELIGSTLSANVHIHSGSELFEAIVFPGVEMGEGCIARNCIIDRGVKLPPGTTVGVDPILDTDRFHVDEESGIVVVSRDVVF